MRLDDIKNVFFVGVGGIGMSALARYFHSRGCRVCGYDKTATSLTRELEDIGMRIIYQDVPEDAGAGFELIIYTPAIPRSNLILQHFQAAGIPVLKRSDVLGVISEGNYNICIAGTHGKTTISTMTAFLLRHSGYGCNAFLGGISTNYGTNFWSDARRCAVIEADEYDRSFLKLRPDIAAITSMDADHLDIYGTEQAMQDAFVEFSQKTREGGLLIAHKGLPRENDLRSPMATYDLTDVSCDIYATQLSVQQGAYHFNVHAWDWMLQDVVLQMGGRHNVENSLVAIAIAHHLGVGDEAIRRAIADFKGVRRRFEFHVRNDDITYIDDYAHHPEELQALIRGVRDLYPGKRLAIIFQPHLFSRTRDCAQGFADALDQADDLLLLPIYPAREEPIAGVDAATIGSRMRRMPVYLESQADALRWIQEHRPTLLVTAGAGDIDQLIKPIQELFTGEVHA